MCSDVYLRSYHIKHNQQSILELFPKAQLVADYAVQNKQRKFISTKEVKHIGLPSAISCQILRKYSSKTIKKATNVNLIVPNSSIKKYTLKDGTEKTYSSIVYENEMVTLKPLKMSFRFNPGREFEKINQVEISKNKFMVTVTFKNSAIEMQPQNVLGIDLNCGVGRFIANACDLESGKVINLGKCGPNIRKKYFKKRKHNGVKGNKESRIMKDLDHKISRKIVDYALKNKLKIVVENLTNIRNGATKRKGFKAGNRLVNSWSFYRLQSFIEYKAKEHNIPFEKVNPHYTSQECCCCQVIGKRNKDVFCCKNKNCEKYNLERHADVNAGFNIAKRSLQQGGRAQET